MDQADGYASLMLEKKTGRRKQEKYSTYGGARK
jgi:hypothetical protein